MHEPEQPNGGALPIPTDLSRTLRAEDAKTPHVDPEYGNRAPSPSGFGSGEGPRSEGDRRDLGFSRTLAALGIAIILSAGALLSLPYLLGGPPLVYLVAYGTALLFGPIGLTLVAASWRIRNRALYGAEVPPWQRRRLRVLGLVLVIVGLFLAFSGFGATGPLSWTLNLVWGLSLAAYGIRYLVRSFASDHS